MPITIRGREVSTKEAAKGVGWTILGAVFYGLLSYFGITPAPQQPPTGPGSNPAFQGERAP